MPKANYITPTGDDFIIPLTFFQSDGQTPANISGDTITLLLKPFDDLPDNDSSVVTITGTIANAANGSAYVKIANSQTAGLSGGYYYKLKVLTASSIITTMAYGVIVFTSRGSNNSATVASGLVINLATGVIIAMTYQQDSFTNHTGNPNLTLSFAPHANSALVFINGILAAAGSQYTISGTTFDWIGTALMSTDQLLVVYVYP